MNREKENRKIQDKLKQIFRLNKSNAGNIITNKGLFLTDDILRDLSKDSSMVTRLKTMKDISEYVATTKLEMNGVEKLWICIEDLFKVDVPLEYRHVAFQFLETVIRHQLESIDVMRAQFFRFIKNHSIPEDLCQRINLLAVLTNSGRDVEHFEEEIGGFLLNCMEAMYQYPDKLPDYLIVIDNVIKFNSPHLDEVIMIGYIQHLCVLCRERTQLQAVVLMALQVLGTIVAYSILPTNCVPEFVSTLCQIVNLQCYAPTAWKIMKNLLGTHLGYSTLFTICRFLQEPDLRNNTPILRGCIFIIHMALWDENSIRSLNCPVNSLLPPIVQVVSYHHKCTDYEILVGLQKLVTKHSKELQECHWTTIFTILDQIITLYPNDTSPLSDVLDEFLNSIETVIQTIGLYHGSLKNFYNLIDRCSQKRSEVSLLKVLQFRSANIVAGQEDWLQDVRLLMTNYFQVEKRTEIRLKTVEILTGIIDTSGQYIDEIVDVIIIPFTQHIAEDGDCLIRTSIVNLLLKLMLNFHNLNCLDLLNILERILYKPFERFNQQINSTNWLESHLDDVYSAIGGLIQLFAKRIHRLPSAVPILILQMFTQFLEMCNNNKGAGIFSKFYHPKLLIFECFLKMRADSSYRLGYPHPVTNQLRYSDFICVQYANTNSNSPPQSPSIQYAPISGIFNSIIVAVSKEKDWDVVSLILRELPKQLQNKSFILGKTGNSDMMNNLVSNLCQMINEKCLNIPDNLNTKIVRMELQTLIILALGTLPSYQLTIDPPFQQLLINTLIMCTGMNPRCSKFCINALTICIVDMRDSMMKLLPEVLLCLSKISATTNIAMPILEFLSTLSQLPVVYGNFVSDQYMAVFAIALPYTNPFKFDNYVVSLAYHVIFVWFLKCRLPFRKDFVKFIVNGLQTNVITPFQEQYNTAMNQDSSDRKRSSSLTEHGTNTNRRQKARSLDGKKPNVGVGTVANATHLMQKSLLVRDKTVLRFYEELNETCIDLMARYTYSPCSPLPKRLPTTDFLLGGGVTKSWMLANKLITITTSGCVEKVSKHGVCDKCWNSCSIKGQQQQQSLSRQNTDESKKSENSINDEQSQQQQQSQQNYELCPCWCQGWAEVLIRGPTGNTSWIMKVQNQLSFKQLINEFPLNEVGTLFLPRNDLFGIVTDRNVIDQDLVNNTDFRQVQSMPGSPTKSRQDYEENCSDFLYDDDENESTSDKSRNPVRRSNSSPEMANWKNPFVYHQLSSNSTTNDDNEDDALNTKKKPTYSKDVRVSCEAIPEEISVYGMGSSPPLNDTNPPPLQPPPQYVTCHSYPGSSPPSENVVELRKPYKTVPPSPNFTNLFHPNNPPTNVMVVTKPPQSPPANTSSKTFDGSIQKSCSSSIIENRSRTNLAQKRDRVHTISVMSTSSSSSTGGGTTTRKSALEKLFFTNSAKVPKEILKSGLNPSFIFLQLYYTACFGGTTDIPLYVHPTTAVNRAISFLDQIYPYETHKIGVVYIHEGQICNSVEILRNTCGSVRYLQFLKGLGSLIRLADINPHMVYAGGLQNGLDGKYFYLYRDDLVMIAFHVATLIPNKETDLNANHKKGHIGNDNVLIVYNNTNEDYDINTIKSQVTLAYIIITPLDYNSNKIVIKTKPELLDIIGPKEVIIVSDQSLAILVRQLALHVDLAAIVMNSLRSHATDPYASNWLERLRKLKNIREKVLVELKNQKLREFQKGFYTSEKDIVEDFTDFT